MLAGDYNYKAYILEIANWKSDLVASVKVSQNALHGGVFDSELVTENVRPKFKFRKTAIYSFTSDARNLERCDINTLRL